MAVCPKGTKTETHNFISVFFGGVAIIVALVIWKLFFWYRNKKRLEREVSRKQKKDQAKIRLLEKKKSKKEAKEEAEFISNEGIETGENIF